MTKMVKTPIDLKELSNLFVIIALIVEKTIFSHYFIKIVLNSVNFHVIKMSSSLIYSTSVYGGVGFSRMKNGNTSIAAG